MSASVELVAADEDAADEAACNVLSEGTGEHGPVCCLPKCVAAAMPGACLFLVLLLLASRRASPSDPAPPPTAAPVEAGLCPPCFSERPEGVRPLPPPEKLCYVHVPKCGEEFHNVVNHAVCPGAPPSCMWGGHPNEVLAAEEAGWPGTFFIAGQPYNAADAHSHPCVPALRTRP